MFFILVLNSNNVQALNTLKQMSMIMKSVARKRQQCKLCDKSFVTVQQLKRHGDKYHYEDDVQDETIKYYLSPKKKQSNVQTKCELCDFDYLIPSELKRHNNLRHSPPIKTPKLTKCKFCAIEYKIPSALDRHMKIRHLSDKCNTKTLRNRLPS